MIELNIDIENEYSIWNLDLDEIRQKTKTIFDYYMTCPEIIENCCFRGCEFSKAAFDIYFCDSQKTHQINKEYRNKDYPANIITFAVFADSPEEERFILDLEINLGEVIIGLDKIIEDAKSKEISKEDELLFMISHGILHLLGFDHQSEEDFDFVVKYQKLALKSMSINYDKI